MKKEKKITTKKLDDLWAKRVKEGGCCEYCGASAGLNAHHIFSRSNYATRWDTENGIALCVSHHLFGNMSAHKSPIEFVEWIKVKRGEKWYAALRKRAKSIVKHDQIYRKKILILLTN